MRINEDHGEDFTISRPAGVCKAKRLPSKLHHVRESQDSRLPCQEPSNLGLVRPCIVSFSLGESNHLPTQALNSLAPSSFGINPLPP